MLLDLSQGEMQGPVPYSGMERLSEKKPVRNDGQTICTPYAVSDADIEAAVADIHTYIDVSPEDLKVIYRFAVQHAHERMTAKQDASKSAHAHTPRLDYPGLAWSVLGAFLGIGCCAFLSAWYFEPRDLTLLIGSFGASAVLVYGAVKSPLAQPRNLIGGHVVSALAGVLAAQVFGFSTLIAAPVAVALALGLMLATRTLHPPGGATALIAVIGGEKIQSLGFLYPLVPVGIGACILLLIALVINNLSPYRKYPETWR